MLSRYMRQNGKFLIFMDAQIRGPGVHENYIWWTALSGVVAKIISNIGTLKIAVLRYILYPRKDG